jgi:hypothetical protein
MGEHFEFALDSGVRVHLDWLHQYRTYAGLLLGAPDREMNQRFIQNALRNAVELKCCHGTPYLIPPVERAMHVPEELRSRFQADRMPFTLPDVVCIASFTAWQAMNDPDAQLSSLEIVWFQDAFGPPIDADVLALLKAIDWNGLAVDWSW